MKITDSVAFKEWFSSPDTHAREIAKNISKLIKKTKKSYTMFFSIPAIEDHLMVDV